MKARAVFAALVAMFTRPELGEPRAALLEAAKLAPSEGLLSEASSFRVRNAFARFVRALSRGGG